MRRCAKTFVISSCVCDDCWNVTFVKAKKTESIEKGSQGLEQSRASRVILDPFTEFLLRVEVSLHLNMRDSRAYNGFENLAVVAFWSHAKSNKLIAAAVMGSGELPKIINDA